MVEYDRTRLPDVYREARALSDATHELWESTLAAILPPGLAVERVLDLGCGTARFVTMLRRLFGAPVVGVDPSLRMLAQREVAGGSVAAGAAEAIPLAGASVDLAFLSMVYHHLQPAAALPELRRIVRPGGHVIVRTPTLEGMDGSIEYTRFFPEALAMNRARMPARAGLVEAFTGQAFTCLEHRVVPSPIAATHAEYLRKIAQRGFSSLQLMPEDAFARGLAELSRYCGGLERDGPVHELVDLFLFRRVQ
jgi:ubiquinone/menaquinone biosynthesis C-methylase UbiE